MTLREIVTKIGFEVDEQGAQQAEERAKGMSTAMKASILGAVAAIGAIGWQALSAAGDMEMLATQFEVMLGSSEKAVVMMDQLKTFSASTPFALNDLATGTQQLLSFGVAEEDVIDRMRMLGDTAGGDSEKLNGLILAFGKVQTKGKASLEEINMMAERGIPIFDVLSEQMGVSKESLFGLISAGKISADDITESFRTMTSEGGMFFEGMEKQSLTFQGLISTMKDNVTLMLASIGETLLPVAKEIVTTITQLVQGPLGDLVGVLVKGLAPVIQTVASLFTNLMGAIEPLSRILSVVFDIITNLLSVMEVLNPIFDILKGIITAVADVLDNLAPAINMIISLLVELMGVFVEFLSGQIMKMLEPLTAILTDVSNIIGDILVALMPLIKIVMKVGVFLLQGFLAPFLLKMRIMLKMFSIVTGWLSTIVSWLTDKLAPAFAKIEKAFNVITFIAKYLFEQLVIWFANLWEDIVALGDNIGSAIFDKIMAGINGIKDAIAWIQNIVREAITWMSELLQRFWDWLFDKFPGFANLISAIGGVFANLWNSVKDMFISIWDVITGAIGTLIEWVNKIPGIDIVLPELEDDPGSPEDVGFSALDDLVNAGSQGFEPAAAPGNVANVQMNNKVDVTVGPGTDPAAVQTAVEDATRAVFTVEMQKVLVNAGY